MRSRRQLIQCLVVAASLAAGVASPAPAPEARQEIEFLLNEIQTSGCIFIRNGTRYDASAATAHLRSKYEVASRSNEIATADDFIRLIASVSSFTGRPYLIDCRTSPPAPTRQWLEDKLKSRRTPHG